MNMRAGTWALGLVGSVIAHVGLLSLLLFAIRPDPVTEQPMPASELEVQAYLLERTEAREQQPESQQADVNTPDGTALDAGAIPQSRARVTPPVIEPVFLEKSHPPLAAETRKAAARIPPIAPPVALLSVSAQPSVMPLMPLTRTESALPVALPVGVPVQTAVPVAPELPQTKTRPSAVPSTTPEPFATLPQKIEGPKIPPVTPSAKRLKASLAFSGSDGDVDPVSIAAFQSFMQPGDIAVSGDQLRDGVSGLLAQVPCSRMQVAFDPNTATLQVNGHIPENDLRAPVLAALRAQMGADITVSDNILILPRPQCGALSGIAGVGLPQSTDQITNPLVIGDDAHARVFTFTKGDLWSLKMTAPDYDAYIYIDYFDAAGNVLHVEPNEQVPLRRATAQDIQQIGAESDLGEGLKLVIGPPYGHEIAVAFAASEPLYDSLRPIQEPAAPYLAWLKAKVAQARSDHTDFKGEWVYFFVSTSEG